MKGTKLVNEAMTTIYGEPEQFDFGTFERRCEAEAVALEDRLCRWISSPQEHELMISTAWPFWHLLLCRSFGIPTKGIRMVNGQWEERT